MFGILAAVTVPRAGVYASLDDLLGDLTSRAQKEGYKIVKLRSHRSKPGESVMRVDLCCERGGQPYKSIATKHKTSTKKTDCPWKAKAVDRKTVGGWVLTVICDQHNHEPGTPEPPTPEQGSEAEDNDAGEGTPDGPQPDPETAAALQVAGVSDSLLRLSGDTFHKFKNDYRKMSQPDRIGMLAQLQLRIAAIYALQNEDLQRQQRQEARDRRHQEVEDNRRRAESQHEESRLRIQSQNESRSHPPQEAMPPGAHSGATLMFHSVGNARQNRALQNRAIAQRRETARQYANIAPTPVASEPHFQPMATGANPASGPMETPVPIPGQVQYRIYPGPPKRIRGQRQGRPARQTAQQTVQQSVRASASVAQQAPQQSAESTPSVESSS
ncbi:transcription factor, FAR1-related protein [Purpureocillium lavendulum]|uniref:Transcription factor, FAR1-related protein n=1 Tax=Purpureocillium lavendulum TaxID=1247861 RepID=A0AB34G143_9HYPO|nr:transcription factor, FAR1-related protein [Purpureocillium lavendulum]